MVIPLSNHERPGISAERVGVLAMSLRKIPDPHRRFGTTRAVADSEYGFKPHDQDLLLSLGFPHIGSGSDVMFDLTDLASTSLYLGLRSARQDAMRFWTRSLRRARRGESAYRIGVRASCPYPRHAGKCSYLVHAAVNPSCVTMTDERQGAAIGVFRVAAGEYPEILPTEVVALVQEFADVEFYFLPTFLALTADFVLEHRIGDCVATARAIVDAATGRGFTARLSYGFISAVPFSSAHTWAEVRVGGRWLPVDPLLPKALRDWGITRADEWPVDLAPLGLYHRIGDEPVHLVSHAGVPAHTWLPTEVNK